MADDLLVEYQEKEYKEVIAEYFFECTGGGVTKPVASPKKEVLKKGIKLHLFRYGFFEKKSTEDTAIDLDGILEGKKKYSVDEVKVANSKIPEVENFYLARTFLRLGYIYIIDKNDNNKYKEYQVDESGKLKGIVWTKDNNGDIRKATGNARPFITINRPGEYYITYSPVQWSKTFFNEINGSDEKKQKFMQIVNCTGIEIGCSPESDEVVSYKDVKVVSFKEHLQRREFRDNLREIHVDEKEQTDEGENSFYEDMFITLNDPIGCANDIGSVLVTKHQKHEAIIESIQTGQSEEDIFARIEKGENRSGTFSDYEEQVNGLFSTALTTYQLIYNDEKMKEEYAETTDKDKLLKILAVKERKELRKVISNIRGDFGTFLSNDYYKCYLPLYTEGGNQAVFEGNYIVASHLEVLSAHPHDKDRHLDLKKDYTGKEDSWKDFYTKMLENDDDEISKLLSKKVKLEELQETILDISKGFSLSKKFIDTLKSITESYAKYATSELKFNVVLKYVKSFKFQNETVVQVKRKELENSISKKGFFLNMSKWVEEDQLANYRSGHRLIRIKTSALQGTPEEIVANKRFEVPIKGASNKASEWITKALEHPKFRAFMAGLEVISTAVSVNKLSSEANIKNGVDTTGGVLSLISATTSYAEAKMLANKGGGSVSAVRTIGNISKITGFIGSGVGVTMCVWDSIETYQARDYDASLTWAITGALSAVLLADSIAAFAAGTVFGFLSFWPLAILFVLVLVGVALAIYFTDTPLEKFLKNNVLGSEHQLVAGNEVPSVYIQQIYNERNRLVESDFKEWRDFKKASQLLYDLLISYRVKENVTQFFYEDKPDKSWGDYIRDAIQLSAGVKYKKVKKVTLKVHLRKFLYNKSSFDFAMRLFVKGTKEVSSLDEMLIADKVIVTTDDNGADVLEVSYTLSKATLNKISLSSEFVFISRTIINEQLKEYWPHKNGNDRYMGYKLSATDWVAPTGDMIIADRINDVLDEVWGTNIRIGTEDEVYNPNTWKR
ncbi:hypothetical protein MHM83_05710 [Tenacibaculum sp. Mcav3-52]|uniref:toxin VasX n=1 Tax=Tenacibaculum sp. Mcav3-52 TaxID=2917762 RepID=UPI001EF20491|nr:toxin VasX [Tenacibaculum sp. Mcav3-52]MCG7501358.1 hypothetical protein [Tenacibaculum sp. Mcav3-52]